MEIFFHSHRVSFKLSFGRWSQDGGKQGHQKKRKPGKLPWKTESVSYELEYGTDALEIHEDAITEGQNVLIVDDLLATGGTAEATCKLVSKLGGNIKGLSVLIELEALNGRKRLNQYNVHSLVQY